MKIVLTKSPTDVKKFRVTFEDGKKVDFGQKGYSDFTLHKNPFRMRSYVRRHGGKVPKTLENSEDPQKVLKSMLNVSTSDKEYWSKNGIKTAGFWSRWLLWSLPNLKDAKRFIESRFNVRITDAT
jgi:hypothetical protein